MTNERAIDELSVIYERLSHPEDCERGVYSFRDGDYLEALDLAIKALEEDRPTGKWIDNQNNSGGGINCSICGKMLPCTDEYWYETDYCPNCGAKMKGELKNEL